LQKIFGPTRQEEKERVKVHIE